jgi:bifunctional non-homologous end joining protein LigD
VTTADIIQDDGERMTACLVNDLNTLIWVANLASVELHVPLARAHSPDRADSMVFDLDPGDQANILDCARLALILRDLLAQMHLACCVKTSGQKGLHVFVPLNSGETTFEQTKKFSKTVAEVLQRNYPDLVTAKMAREHRKNRVFINWAQNDASKTMICVYSLRARERPTVSFPLGWKELEDLAGQGDPERFQVIHSEALTRAERDGDLFREVLVRRKRLPYL